MKIHYALSALVWLVCCSAQADIIHVPGDLPDIQTAINVAVNGDEIIVAPGTYFETINFLGKAITVRSTDPTDPAVVLSTIIDGNSGGSVVTCTSGEGAGSILNGFFITGGTGTVSGISTLGGGMYVLNSSPTVTNCSFSGNTLLLGFLTFGGGMYNENSSPTVTNCTFSGNSGNSGGGMLNNNSSPTMTNCLFSGNTARSGGGMFNTTSNPTVTNCIFSGNSASNFGGGIYNEGSSIPTVINCWFSGNMATRRGGGMYITSSNPKVINCSFSGNSASILGGGIYINSGFPKITNCILWGDSPTEIVINSGSPTVTYSNVQGGFAGTGNIDLDPLFADPLGADAIAGTGDEDLSLSIGSPCIDAGNNIAVPLGVTTDLDGNPRFLDDPGTPDTGVGSPPVVDMGAYEFDPSCLADSSGDGLVNVTDLLELLGAWGACPAPCPPDNTGDGQVNVTDLLSLLALWGVCP